MQLNLPWSHHRPMPRRARSARASRFPNRVRELREAAEPWLSQEQLGDRLGVTFSAVGKLERGETRLRVDQAEALAGIFKVHWLELFLPVSPEEREALNLLREADPALRRHMVDTLRMLTRSTKATTKAA